MDKFVTVVIFGAIFWYIKSCYTEALKQKYALIKLRVYVFDWKSKILEGNYFVIYKLAEEFVKRENSLIKSEKVTRFANNNKVFKRFIRMQVALVFNRDDVLDKQTKEEFFKNINTFEGIIRDSPQKFIHEYSEKLTDRILEGKTYITDNEAVLFGDYGAICCHNLKLQTVELIDKVSFLSLFLLSKESFEGINDCERTRKLIEDICFTGLLFCKWLKKVEEIIEINKQKSNLSLTLDRMFSI